MKQNGNVNLEQKIFENLEIGIEGFQKIYKI